MNSHQKLLDCVSAKELLQALNTLNNITEEPASPDFQLSFSHTSHSFFQQPPQQHQQNMDFQMYMAKKNDLKQNKENKKKKNNISNISQKSLTPTKKASQIKQKQQKPSTQKSQIQQFKSRSHSPAQYSYSPKPKPKTKANKQNQPEKFQKKESTKVSFQSRKILEEREKKGKSYVPIQLRASQLLKSKQQKIAKIQKINNTFKEIEDKECTFKPTIQKWKKQKKEGDKVTVKNRHKDCSQTMTDFSGIMTQNEIQSHLPIQRKQKSALKEVKQKHDTNRTSQIPQSTIRKGKYKNQKFNMLLDLIN